MELGLLSTIGYLGNKDYDENSKKKEYCYWPFN